MVSIDRWLQRLGRAMAVATVSCILFQALGSVVGSAAQAQQTKPHLTRFEAYGEAFQLPRPLGLCEPTGKYIDIARGGATADSISSTVLTLFDCEDMTAGRPPARVLIVKVPIAGAAQSVSLPQLMAGFDDYHSRKAGAGPTPANGSSEAAQSVLSALGVTGAGNFSRDDFGGYITKSSQPVNPNKSVFVSGVSGITSIRGHVIMIELIHFSHTAIDRPTELDAVKSELHQLQTINGA